MSRQGRPEGGRKPTLAVWIAALLLLLVAAAAGPVWRALRSGQEEDRTITYSAFRAEVRRGNVAQVEFRGARVRGELRQAVEGESGEPAGRRVVTFVPSIGDPGLLALLDANGVEIRTVQEGQSSLFVFVSSVVPVLLFIVLAFFLFKRLGGEGQQIFTMGRSRARLHAAKDLTTRFGDVAGADGAKSELREIIDFLKDPARFQKIGGKPPKGVLLVGAPGTGKTLLARATAGESGVPFFSISGSDFMEMFVGVGASRVRDLFREARKQAPAIVFIDEIDSIGRRRGGGSGGSHDEREQTLNQLLAEMDGFEPREGAIVMAATNRPESLDPALLRPGRFDRRITVELPGVAARKAILVVHARNKPLAPDVDLDMIARGTPGFSGADLANLLNEAALLAVRSGLELIDRSQLEKARDKIILGLEREGVVLTEEELELLAYHEGGHAVVAALVPWADPLHKVTIVPRGRAMGVTHQIPERDRYIYSRDYLLDRMAVMMGGRAAEAQVLGTATTGAENDLKETAKLARRMVVDWGMSFRLANLALSTGHEGFLGEEDGRSREYSEATAREVDEEIRAITEAAFRRAVKILDEHRAGLDAVARALLDNEEISGERVRELLEIRVAVPQRREMGEAPARPGRGGHTPG